MSLAGRFPQTYGGTGVLGHCAHQPDPADWSPAGTSQDHGPAARIKREGQVRPDMCQGIAAAGLGEPALVGAANSGQVRHNNAVRAGQWSLTNLGLEYRQIRTRNDDIHASMGHTTTRSSTESGHGRARARPGPAKTSQIYQPHPGPVWAVGLSGPGSTSPAKVRVRASHPYKDQSGQALVSESQPRPSWSMVLSRLARARTRDRSGIVRVRNQGRTRVWPRQVSYGQESANKATPAKARVQPRKSRNVATPDQDETGQERAQVAWPSLGRLWDQ